jgi:hypothetical protein
LNTFLVWAGVRECTLPDWEYINENDLRDFIDFLNKLPQQKFRRVVIVEFQHSYFDGCIVSNRIITRENNPICRFHKSPSPITDFEIGLACGFHLRNVTHYVELPVNGTRWAYRVEESTSGALMFAEVFFPDHLSPFQLDEFHKLCKSRIILYNRTMKEFNWPFRFRGVDEN